jgi:hypothetical protein
LPKFAAELEKTFSLDKVDRVETLSAAMNRLKNNVTELVNGFQEAGGANVLGGFFDFVGESIKFLETGAAATGAYTAAVVDSLGDVSNAITDLDFDGLGDKVSSNFSLAGDVADDAADKIVNAGKKIESAGQQINQASGAVQKILQVTAAETASFRESIDRAFSALNLDVVAQNISTAEKKFTQAFDTISERSGITQQALLALRNALSGDLSPAGIQAVTGALDEIFKNGGNAKTVIEDLRNQLLTIEPSANIGQITDGLSDMVRLGDF